MALRNANSRSTTIAILGGLNHGHITDSVLLLSLDETGPQKQWRPGTSLNAKRRGLAAVRCGDCVYAMGGYHVVHSPVDQGHSGMSTMNEGMTGRVNRLDTIEQIPVSHLVGYSPRHHVTNQWETLECRMSEARCGCAAVAIHDRFIVVIGGYNGQGGLSSVDVIDTEHVDYTHPEKSAAVVVVLEPGPDMNSARWCCGAAVLNHGPVDCPQIWVLGGMNNNHERMNSIEVFSFNDWLEDACRNKCARAKPWQSPCWKTQADLALEDARAGHAVTCMHSTSCFSSLIVVAGGYSNHNTLLSSVEVVDPKRGKIWRLPNLSEPRHGCTIVAMNTMSTRPGAQTLLVVGGSPVNRLDSIETCSFVEVSWEGLASCRDDLQHQQLHKWSQNPRNMTKPYVPDLSRKRLHVSTTQLNRVQLLWNTLLYFHLLHKEGSAFVEAHWDEKREPSSMKPFEQP